MICDKCGAQMKDDSLYCIQCGKPVQIVPDYNPIDELVTKNVESLLKEEAAVSNPEKTDQVPEEKPPVKSRKKLFILLAAVIVIGAGVSLFFLFSGNREREEDSYQFHIESAITSMENKSYEDAAAYLSRASELEPERARPYYLMGKLCLETGDEEAGIENFIKATELDPGYAKAYEILVELFEEADEPDRIRELFASCKDEEILETFADYIPVIPEASAADNQVILKAGDCSIYYTMDNTEPTVYTNKYINSIELEEGRNLIRAISISKNGIVSEEVSFTFQGEAKAPAMPRVEPSDGVYTEAVPIVIEVPEGSNAYYTWDGTPPTPADDEYTGPIEMLPGDNILSVVIIDRNGRQSEILMINYHLI